MRTEPRHVAILIPYRKNQAGDFEYFLQFGDPRNTGVKHYRYFGGQIDPGETAEQALVREIKEELDYDLKNYQYLGQFNDERAVRDVYYHKVESDFEDKITVLEGDFGQFKTNQEAQALPNFSATDKKVFQALEDKLTLN